MGGIYLHKQPDSNDAPVVPSDNEPTEDDAPEADSPNPKETGTPTLNTPTIKKIHWNDKALDFYSDFDSDKNKWMPNDKWKAFELILSSQKINISKFSGNIKDYAKKPDENLSSVPPSLTRSIIKIGDKYKECLDKGDISNEATFKDCLKPLDDSLNEALKERPKPKTQPSGEITSLKEESPPEEPPPSEEPPPKEEPKGTETSTEITGGKHKFNLWKAIKKVISKIPIPKFKKKTDNTDSSLKPITDRQFRKRAKEIVESLPVNDPIVAFFDKASAMAHDSDGLTPDDLSQLKVSLPSDLSEDRKKQMDSLIEKGPHGPTKNFGIIKKEWDKKVAKATKPPKTKVNIFKPLTHLLQTWKTNREPNKQQRIYEKELKDAMTREKLKPIIPTEWNSFMKTVSELTAGQPFAASVSGSQFSDKQGNFFDSLIQIYNKWIQFDPSQGARNFENEAGLLWERNKSKADKKSDREADHDLKKKLKVLSKQLKGVMDRETVQKIDSEHWKSFIEMVQGENRYAFSLSQAGFSEDEKSFFDSLNLILNGYQKLSGPEGNGRFVEDANSLWLKGHKNRPHPLQSLGQKIKAVIQDIKDKREINHNKRNHEKMLKDAMTQENLAPISQDEWNAFMKAVEEAPSGERWDALGEDYSDENSGFFDNLIRIRNNYPAHGKHDFDSEALMLWNKNKTKADDKAQRDVDQADKKDDREIRQNHKALSKELKKAMSKRNLAPVDEKHWNVFITDDSLSPDQDEFSPYEKSFFDNLKNIEIQFEELSHGEQLFLDEVEQLWLKNHPKLAKAKIETPEPEPVVVPKPYLEVGWSPQSGLSHESRPDMKLDTSFNHTLGFEARVGRLYPIHGPLEVRVDAGAGYFKYATSPTVPAENITQLTEIQPLSGGINPLLRAHLFDRFDATLGVGTRLSLSLLNAPQENYSRCLNFDEAGNCLEASADKIGGIPTGNENLTALHFQPALGTMIYATGGFVLADHVWLGVRFGWQGRFFQEPTSSDLVILSGLTTQAYAGFKF